MKYKLLVGKKWKTNNDFYFFDVSRLKREHSAYEQIYIFAHTARRLKILRQKGGQNSFKLA